MNPLRPCALLMLASAASVISGCAVGPDFHRPAAPAVNGYTAEPLTAAPPESGNTATEAQRFVEDQDIPAQWWTLFHSPQINALVEQALKANPNVHAAEAALRVAMEEYKAQRGIYFPSVQASASPSRQLNAVGTLAPTLTSAEPLFNLYTAQVSVSYVLDVFGGNRRQVESSAAQADYQRYELEATYLTLCSNVVAAAIQEASLRAQIDATEEIVRIESEVLLRMRKQLELGSIAEGDVVAQRAALAQAEAMLPGLHKQLASQRTLLSALAGDYPNQEPAARFDLASLQLPTDLPVSLPSKLVNQRPDVRAAEEQLHAASAQVGVAVSNMLPQITLSAVAGTSATSTAALFASGNNFWSVAGGLTQPLFAGGSLLHHKRAADAALQQAAAQYQAAVIAAFENVSDSLRAIQFDAETLDAQLRAEHAAAESLEIARHQVDLGSVSPLALLIAEQSYQQAHLALTQAVAARLTDTAALFQALGGGWWNRADQGELRAP